MIEALPESTQLDTSNLDLFRTAVQAKWPDVRLGRIGEHLIVFGVVPAYSIKAAIEAEAQQLGLAIQNSVRVVPGREWQLSEGFSTAG